MPLRAAVFDFDGVIVDSEPLHFRSLREALLPEGVSITERDYVLRYLAYDDREAIRLALLDHAGGAPRECLDRVEARKVLAFARLIPEVPVFPGARDLVRALAERMPVAIASGARHEEVEAILRGLSLRDAFAEIVGAEDAPRTKPDPAPYLEAARRLAARANALSPGECIAFEDSVPGIASALGAGMKVVGVAHSLPAEKLRAAHRVVDSLAGLRPDELGGLFES